MEADLSSSRRPSRIQVVLSVFEQFALQRVTTFLSVFVCLGFATFLSLLPRICGASMRHLAIQDPAVTMFLPLRPTSVFVRRPTSVLARVVARPERGWVRVWQASGAWLRPLSGYTNQRLGSNSKSPALVAALPGAATRYTVVEPNPMADDPYERLGLARSCTAKELKHAYRRAARRFHPDTNQDDKNTEEKFVRLSEAYNLLRDDEERANYDQTGEWPGATSKQRASDDRRPHRPATTEADAYTGQESRKYYSHYSDFDWRFHFDPRAKKRSASGSGAHFRHRAPPESAEARTSTQEKAQTQAQAVKQIIRKLRTMPSIMGDNDSNKVHLVTEWLKVNFDLFDSHFWVHITAILRQFSSDRGKLLAFRMLVRSAPLQPLRPDEVTALLREFSFVSDEMSILKDLLKFNLVSCSGKDLHLILREFSCDMVRLSALQLLSSMPLEPLNYNEIKSVLQTVSSASSKVTTLNILLTSELVGCSSDELNHIWHDFESDSDRLQDIVRLALERLIQKGHGQPLTSDKNVVAPTNVSELRRERSRADTALASVADLEQSLKNTMAKKKELEIKLNETLSRERSRADTAAARVAELEERLQTYEVKNDTAAARLAELEQRLQRYEGKNDTAASRVAELEQRLQAYEVKNKDLQALLTKESKRVIDLELDSELRNRMLQAQLKYYRTRGISRKDDSAIDQPEVEDPDPLEKASIGVRIGGVVNKLRQQARYTNKRVPVTYRANKKKDSFTDPRIFANALRSFRDD